MRTICILDQRDEMPFRSAFAKANLIEDDNFLCFHNFETAKDFLVRALVSEQKHSDVLVISEDLKNNNFHQHLVDWIRFSNEEYSSANFKLASIPIIKYDYDNRSIFERDNPLGYTKVISRRRFDNKHLHLVDTIGSAVRHFRQSILDDLDNLGIDFRQMKTSISYTPPLTYMLTTATDAEFMARVTRVLSRSFIANPRKLKYDWLVDNLITLENALEEYEKILRKRNAYNRKNSERTVLHRFFNNNEWALRRDVYEKMYYEQRLKKSNAGAEIPDYILASPLPDDMPTTIFEVKLNDIELISSEKRKPDLKRDFRKGLIQLSDYRRHLAIDKNKKALEEEILGYPVTRRNINYKLLAGNDEALQKNENRIKELLRDHYSKVGFLTHDQLLVLMTNYYQRIQNYGIF